MNNKKCILKRFIKKKNTISTVILMKCAHDNNLDQERRSENEDTMSLQVYKDGNNFR